jgi:arylsulfatase A-like enzyme
VNFVLVCLHCLDLRDFHSHLRDTPFLDRLCAESIFIPTGRAQGHHQGDSLNAELTGVWTARYCDSTLREDGFRGGKSCWLPETMIEMLDRSGFHIVTRLAQDGTDRLGTHAVGGGMTKLWLKHEPERLEQFESPRPMDLDEWLDEIRDSDSFYAHVFLRNTHRPWGDPDGLYALFGEKAPEFWGYPHDVSRARRAALQKPDELAALRRRGLAAADRIVERIFEATRDKSDVTYLVYSNHGEVFDHFRYHLPHPDPGDGMIRGTSHGPYPYEVLYANMQMWVIPGQAPRVMAGVGRSIDIAPTILDLAGVESTGLDGESMLGHFDSGRFPDRDRYAENELGACVSMVRSDGWKLISTGVQEAEPPREAPDYHRLAVFDLRSDPHELVNLVDTPQGTEVLEWAVERHRELEATRVPVPATT